MTATQAKNRTVRTYKRSSDWLTKALRLAIYIRDEFTCAYCGTCLRDARPFDITLDHLDPRSTTLAPAARRNPKRLVTACRSCNSSRRATPWRQFATGGAILRIERLVARQVNLPLARAILAGRTNAKVEAR